MLSYKSLCDLAHRFPEEIASFIELECLLRRGTFREDSITDLLIASMLRSGGKNVAIQVPIEQKTGADFDLSLVDPTTKKLINYRIQAKRLRSRAKIWDRNAYRELAHPENTGTQSAKLISESASVGSIPLYAFYNPDGICKQSSGQVSGINLADAHAIRLVVLDIVASKGTYCTLRQLRHLMAMFFPLSTILCPPTVPSSGSRTIATPNESRAAFQRVMRARTATEVASDSVPPLRAATATIMEALHRREAEPVRRVPVERPRVIVATS